MTYAWYFITLWYYFLSWNCHIQYLTIWLSCSWDFTNNVTVNLTILSLKSLLISKCFETNLVSKIYIFSLQLNLRMFFQETFQYVVVTMLNLELKTGAVRVNRKHGFLAESIDAIGRGCMTSVSCVCHSSVTLDGVWAVYLLGACICCSYAHRLSPEYTQDVFFNPTQ